VFGRLAMWLGGRRICLKVLSIRVMWFCTGVVQPWESCHNIRYFIFKIRFWYRYTYMQISLWQSLTRQNLTIRRPSRYFISKYSFRQNSFWNLPPIWFSISQSDLRRILIYSFAYLLIYYPAYLGSILTPRSIFSMSGERWAVFNSHLMLYV
jgi:hypothetical protein